MVLLGIHSIVYTYFVATGKWAKEVVRVYQLPDWYIAQAKRNKRRAFRFVMGSMTAIAVAAWLGGAADTLGPAYAAWHLAAAAMALAFNFGSFVVEYAAIVGHARLLMDLKDQADRLRAERYGTRRDKRAGVGRRWPVTCGGSRRMSPLGVVVLIVLVDLLGFSVVMPLLAPFAKHYGFRAWQIGLLFSAYPMCQLVAGPILGRLSDRYGRRPLLVFSQAGTAVSFLILGLSRDVLGDAAGADARRRLRRQHPGGAGVCGRRDQARGPRRRHGPDRHGVRAGVRAGSAAGRPAAQLAGFR